MMQTLSNLHFLRPIWFFALIPWLVLFYYLVREKALPEAWRGVCDPHLLPHLIQKESLGAKKRALLCLLGALFFMILSLTGPAFKKQPAPTFHAIHPRLILLDLSADMLNTDIKPNRLTRAKFKLHDLFQSQDAGQFGLIVYTGEPFVVSPLTLDAQTIDALVNQLDPSIMPVAGNHLVDALKEAKKLIAQSGVGYGDLLVITGTAPSQAAISMAKKLSKANLETSVLALIPPKTKNTAAFRAFAQAGKGQMLRFTHTDKDIKAWLKQASPDERLQADIMQSIPLWRDDGRWFLIPALLCLLPVFRRAWLLRIST